MRQNDLSPVAGSRKSRKRVGRGDGSGHGTFSGRGQKGQKARAGGKTRPGFEGGQLPLIKRLPKKRGFFNAFRTEYSVVNLNQLRSFEEGTEITPEKLISARMVKSSRQPIKVLASGDLDRPLIVKANKFSAAARAKIEAAGGTAQEVGYVSTEVD